jgi:hypothetical protein
MPAEVGGRPSSIARVLAAARRRRTQNSALESTALGLCAVGIGVAAALLSGTSAEKLAALAACGLLCGASMAGTWWVERAKLGELDLARRLDRKLGLDGALATAFELRGDERGGGLVPILEQRVLARLGPEQLRSCQPAPGWSWLALPAIGALMVALALELPSSVAKWDMSRAPGGFQAAPAGPLASAEALLQALQSGDLDPELDRNGLAAQIEAALAELPSVGPALRTPSGLSAAELSAQLLQARAALSHRESPGAGAFTSDPRTGSGSGANSSDASEGADSALAIGSLDRTIVGSNPPAAEQHGRPAESPSAPQAGAGEAGTLAGRWWPERYDPVVQGWRRALAARGDGR